MGSSKVSEMLLTFFSSDQVASQWFLTNSTIPTPSDPVQLVQELITGFPNLSDEEVLVALEEILAVLEGAE